MYKKILLSFLLCVNVTCVLAQVTINFTFGVLSNSSGTAISDGSLLLIIGSSNGTFSAPSITSFTGGNLSESILFKGSFDSTTTGLPGGMSLSLNPSIPTADGITTGSRLNVYWFPSLTSSANAPGADSSYGVYGFSTGDSVWTVPSLGSTINIDMLTASAGGTLLDSAGVASFSTSAIPEPNTYAAIFGLTVLGFVAYRRMRNYN